MLTRHPLLESLPVRVAASAVGPHRRLTLPHLIRLFQEAALVNTDRLAVSSAELTERFGLTWVLHRQVIEADRWPEMGHHVTVITLPTHIERQLVTYRDFYLLDEDGAAIIRSTTAWSLMSLDARRIRPIPAEVEAVFTDLPGGEDQLPRPGDKPRAPEEPTESLSFRVDFSHLDFNNHLTNPAFPEWMLEPLGRDFLAAHLPRLADISYHREARYGEAIEARTESAGREGFDHALYRNGEDVLATMRTAWTPLL